MLNYLKNFASDCKAGYRAAMNQATESTQDFKAGFTVGDRTTDTLVSQQMAALARSKPAKKTKAGTPEDDARKAAHAEVQSFNPLIAASQKASLSFKVGRWMRNPLINTWKFVKSLWNGTSTTQKIVSAVAVCAFGAFVAAAINVLGFSLLATTTLTAAASIGFSRAVFIKHKISWYVECLVDVTIFVAYTMFLMS